jgi:integrase
MLSLVQSPNVSFPPQQGQEDHMFLLNGYFQSHRIRNHSPKTIAKERAFLLGWFASNGSESQHLLTWEAMAPIQGRKRMVDYGTALLESGLTSDTIRAYLGILSRYFSYVLEHPYILGPGVPRRIQECYGAIDQPISEYDMPQHTYDGERLGVPFDPERLYEFYAQIRKYYLNSKGSCPFLRSRNYAMVVLAGESGLRADEILNLEISLDLFFDSKKLQTRFAKGTKGSGKRARITLFTPLSRDTLKFYLKEHRPHLLDSDRTDYLFPSKSGKLMSYSSAHQALSEVLDVVRGSHFPIASHMSWHWLRRLFATRFIERFPNKLPVLISLLGHQSPNTVHRYIRHSEAWMDQQIQSVIEGTSTWLSPGD